MIETPYFAKMFHESYERLAPQFGYETRRDSAVPWEQLPEKNKRLMEAVCSEVVMPLYDALLAADEAVRRARWFVDGHSWPEPFMTEATGADRAFARYAEAREKTTVQHVGEHE